MSVRKWEAFVVACLACMVVAGVLLAWSVQLLNLIGLSREENLISTVAFLLGGFSFGLIPAIPVIYKLENAGKAQPK